MRLILTRLVCFHDLIFAFANSYYGNRFHGNTIRPGVGNLTRDPFETSGGAKRVSNRDRISAPRAADSISHHAKGIESKRGKGVFRVFSVFASVSIDKSEHLGACLSSVTMSGKVHTVCQVRSRQSRG